MRRPKMTTRRWMTVVAVVGLLLGVVIWGRRLRQRREYCLQQASNHAREEKVFRSMATRLRPPEIIVGEHTYQADTLAAYHAEWKTAYLHTASRPWLSVPPDAPNFTMYFRGLFSGTAVIEVPNGPQPTSADSPRR
jgi:hypothetical protein